ncbi:MAG: hypothetical protein PHD37_07995 [Gallionellaceae bacterium]|nr:hypothetical protein [Gallionellaceae bacterium]
MTASSFVLDSYSISFASLVLPLMLVGISLAPALVNRKKAGWAGLMAPVIILCIGALIYYFRMDAVQNYELNPDESDWIANANTLLVDPRYMISTVMPLLITAPLSLVKLFTGNLDFYTTKIFGIITWIACFILLWAGLRNIFRTGLEFFALLPFVAFVALMSHWDLVAYNSEHSPSLLFSLAVFIYSHTQRDRTNRYTYPLLGFVLGSFLLSKIQMAPVAFAFALVVAINLARQGKIKTLLLFCTSGFAPIVVVLNWVYVNGAMDVFIATHKAALGYVLSGVTGEHLTWPEKISGFRDITNSIPDLHLYLGCYALIIILVTSMTVLSAKRINHWVRYLFVAQAIALPFFLGPALTIAIESLVYFVFCLYSISRFDDGFREYFVVLGISTVLMLTSFYVITAPPTNFSHYYILMVAPVSFYGSVVLLSGMRLLNNYAANIAKKNVFILCIVSALTIFQFNGLHTKRVIGIHSLYHDRPSYINRENDAAIANTIRMWINPGDRITIWGWSNKFYVLSQAAQATRITFSFPQFLKGNADIYWLNLFITDMEKNNPIVFVDAIAPNQFMYDYFKGSHFEIYPRAKRFIENNYTQISTISGVRIYIKNTRLNRHQISYQPGPRIIH